MLLLEYVQVLLVLIQLRQIFDSLVDVILEDTQLLQCLACEVVWRRFVLLYAL